MDQASRPPGDERLRSLAPSAKLVATTLEHEGALTQTQLAEETRLPVRTVRHALSDLDDAGLVAARISFTDARRRIYSLEDAGAEDASAGPES